MELKRNLKLILAQREMTAADLSRASGVPKTTLGEWLAGGSPRDLRKLKLLAQTLGVSIDWLLFGDPMAEPAKLESHLSDINAGIFEVILRKPKTNGDEK